MTVLSWIMLAVAVVAVAGLVVLGREYLIVRKLIYVYRMSYTTMMKQYEALDADYDRVVEYVIEKHKDDPKHPTKKKHEKTVNKDMVMSEEEYKKLLSIYQNIKKEQKEHDSVH